MRPLTSNQSFEFLSESSYDYSASTVASTSLDSFISQSDLSDSNILSSLVEDLVNDVILSTNHQFSASGVVCDVTTEHIEKGTKNASVLAGELEKIRVKKENSSNESQKHLSTIRQEKKPQYKTLMKIRKYETVDGQKQVSVSSKIIISGQENKKVNDHNLWKADLREMKILQKVENKQCQNLAEKHSAAIEQLTKKFESDKLVHLVIISCCQCRRLWFLTLSITLLKSSEVRLEQIVKKHKVLMVKMEATQVNETRQFNSKIKMEQTKELKAFRDGLKNEMKKLKDSVGSESDCSSSNRENMKDLLKRRKEQKEAEHEEKDRKFVELQKENLEKATKSLLQTQRNAMSKLEKMMLQEKQHLLKLREGELWEMEEKQMEEMNKLVKMQLKDSFFLKRNQMMDRQEKEMELCHRANNRQKEELNCSQLIEKKRLPKIQKADCKTRIAMYRQSLKIGSMPPLNADEEKEKIKMFEEKEKERMKADTQRMLERQKKQKAQLQERINASVKELELIQNEKRRMLIDFEMQKMKTLEEDYHDEVRRWKAELPIRKRRLEQDFAQQQLEQERFYSLSVSPTIAVSTINSRILNSD
ncbi:hypothetical protein HELRODRAFT_189876 [Helobdella robusta]|uniref:Uncharacterized protein n=1 Tax=Helobdella robusta TaxID=6412 RepID=T1FRF9_HELRO|nr:hypothetical protein HELRODRAFT_189876 [Helobdella robusta]ESN90506.1 hypothetical protein HELRODRAFT_189876 [Helobdella robusta]